MPSKSAKHRKALREIAISNLKKDRNFFVVGLTYGCLRSCTLLCSTQAPASARTFISFMRPDFVKEKILLYNLLILRITGILKIMPVIDNPYGSR